MRFFDAAPLHESAVLHHVGHSMGNASGQILITSYHLPHLDSCSDLWGHVPFILILPCGVTPFGCFLLGSLNHCQCSGQGCLSPATSMLEPITGGYTSSPHDTSVTHLVRMPSLCVFANKKLPNRPRWKPGPGFFESCCAVVQQSGEIATHLRHCITAVTPTCQLHRLQLERYRIQGW